MVLKRRFLLVMVLLLALAAEGLAAAENLDYVRLHVIAGDDSARAQALKLKVRDAVLIEARALLAGVDDADAAWKVIRENRAGLEAAALVCARLNGFDGKVACQVGIFPFPDRRYGDTLLPAGNYRALRVVLGEGHGHNWWCVLYPALCYPEGVDPAHPQFHSVILDWLRGLFGGDAS